MTKTTFKIPRTYLRINTYKSYEGFINASIRSSVVTLKDEREGTPVPTWKSLVARGLDAGSPYVRTIGPRIKKSDNVNWLWRFYEYDPDYKPRLASYRVSRCAATTSVSDWIPSNPTWLDVSDLEQQATIAFLNKAREEITPFQALPFLGELTETVRMIRHPLSGIAKHTRRYNRSALLNSGRLKKVGHLLDAYADLYLQWTYGVSPLLGDIEGAVEACKKLLSTDVKPIPISVTFKDFRQELVRNPEVKSYFLGARFLETITRSRDTKLQIKGAVRSDVEHPLKDRAIPVLGISLEEFVPTLWELIPYSFLVDYVTNVGDLLGAKSVALADLAWYWLSEKQVQTVTSVCIPMPWYWPGRPTVKSPPPIPSVAQCEHIVFKRRRPALTVSFKRGFKFTTPSLDQSVKSAVLAFASLRR